MSSPEVLKFQPFSSAVNVSFWHEFVKRKLEDYRLSEDPIEIAGHYSINNAKGDSVAHFEVDSESFLKDKVLEGDVTVLGSLINTNTIESFKDLDKTNLFIEITTKEDIISGNCFKHPYLLNRFLLVTFGDLKNYKFYYWFGFPALPFSENIIVQEVKPLSQVYRLLLIEELCRLHALHKFPPFFLIKAKENSIQIGSIDNWDTFWESEDEKTLGFVDPSSLEKNPGWPLRNFLFFIFHKYEIKEISVVCYREKLGQTSSSLYLKLQFPEVKITTMPTGVGWEKNHQNKLAPRFVSIASSMNPYKLASSSVDLNLKLMKWRLLPNLDLKKVCNAKCLLLGAGTLGCNVARSLLAWGVKNITFVDNGKVSFSNPVRQTLFEFEDCLEGGKFKALVAAEKLKKIFPEVNSKGVVLSIPMPGHPITKDEVSNIMKTVEELMQLIQEHDVVFVLTDSRESRWLPTLFCAAFDKLCINVALGFDSYLILRHGIQGNDQKLGCYFCNDVVGPQNSQKQRSLDQQCTVTRPGLSPTAASLAVELMVSLLHHSQGIKAPSDLSRPISEPVDHPFGLIPHSIRGFITHFANILITGEAYDKCTACSSIVIEEFKRVKFDFLLEVFNTPKYLEDLTGLTTMKIEAEKVEWEICEKDDF